MAQKNIEEALDIPQGVTATVEGGLVTIKGEKGELSRRFRARGVSIALEGNTVKLLAENVTQREKKLFFTFKAHIKNMIRGVQEGYTYKLKICSGHFPMSVSLKGNTFEIKNFIGEKVPRQLTIKEGAEVKVEGDKITVFAIDKELAGQVAADIEKLTRRTGFDKRIFQDGIYITEKAGKAM